MNVLEAIDHLVKGHRVLFRGDELLLENGMMQRHSGNHWVPMEMSPRTMEGYTLAELSEYEIIVGVRLVFSYVGDLIPASSAVNYANFKGYKFADGHIGATLWCVKSGIIYRATHVLLENI